MNPKIKLAAIINNFTLGSAGQQLLDRLLIGYPRDGKFHKPSFGEVWLHTPSPAPPEIQKRMDDFGLKTSPDTGQVLDGAGALLLDPMDVPPDPESQLPALLAGLPPNSRCFVAGPLARNYRSALDLARLARFRKITLLAGSPLPLTWKLPPIQVPDGTRLERALIVVQGPRGRAEFDGLEGLLPLVENRRGGEAGIRQVRFLAGASVWDHHRDWSWDLLSAALSRSDTPQGDPVLDGRTQDLVKLGLVTKLAREPRAWIIDHRDGLRTAILVLDGVIADFNVALRARNGTAWSAQLYRPPKPQDHQFTPLAAALDDFFIAGKTPWPPERNLLEAGLLDAFVQAEKQPGEWLETRDLALPV